MHYNMGYSREQAVVQAANQMKPKTKVPYGQLDPDDLSRRLRIVLAEQRAHAERKRKTRAETGNAAGLASSEKKAPAAESFKVTTTITSTSKRTEGKQVKSAETSSNSFITELRQSRLSRLNARAKAPPSGPKEAPTSVADEKPSEYHHIPKEAAKQFARTTTVETMQGSLARKFSKQGLKGHRDGTKADKTAVRDTKQGPERQEKSPRRQQDRREKTADLTQSQFSQLLEETAETEAERRRAEERARQRHTFEGELSRLKPVTHELQGEERRNSTGNLLERKEVNRHSLNAELLMETVLEDGTLPEDPDPLQASEHRVDWTQSDETKHRPRLLLTPLLRKADSIWTLRGRLGNKGSHDTVQLPPDGTPTLKSPKSSFFTKFRR